ncbi:hypothetical protein H4219_005814, partial [Mycoemilia scoparia]
MLTEASSGGRAGTKSNSNSMEYAIPSKLPTLTPEYIKKNYPSYLKLVGVQVFHRHGERAPMTRRFDTITPQQWNLCEQANQFQSALARSVNQHLPHPLSKHVDDNGEKYPAVWLYNIFSDIKSSNAFKNISKPPNNSGGGDDDNSSSLHYGYNTCEYGQLTDRGRKSMQRVGTFLRDLYINHLGFLPRDISSSSSSSSEADKNQIYLRSTQYTRAIESLHQLVTGLYPNSVSPNAPESSRLAMNIKPALIDDMYIHYDQGQGFKELNRHQLLAQQKIKHLYEPFIKSLFGLESIGKDIQKVFESSKFLPLVWVYDTLISMHFHDIPLPKDVTPSLLGELSHHAFVEAYAPHAHPSNYFTKIYDPIARLVTKNVVDAAVAANNNINDNSTQGLPPTPPKFRIYSAHDVQLSAILLLLGDHLTNEHKDTFGGYWPPYSSTIRIELLRDENEISRSSSSSNLNKTVASSGDDNNNNNNNN